jgi:hypothetical protein
LALFDKEVSAIVPNLDDRVDVTAESARRDLGVEFRPATDAIVSAGRFIIENKLI